jgi:GT2 family glycosyltransferase
MIDIIIPHYGPDYLLHRCIRSIEASTQAEYNLIVVDNNERNRGFAKACNEGICSGTGDYVMLLNNDTVVPHGWLSRLQAVLECDPQIAAVGPLSTAPTQWQWVHNVASLLSVNLPANDFITSDVVKFPSQLAFWCVLIPRRVLNDVGLLDERFFMYCEDDDWCLCAHKAGYKLALDLATVVKHDHRKNYNAEVRRIHEGSFEKLQEKWSEYVIKPPNVYVAILNQGTVRIELANLLIHSLKPRPDLGNLALSFPNTKPIADNRNRIVLDFLTSDRVGKLLKYFVQAEATTPQEVLERFLTNEWDYLMMIDDDVVPYRDPLELIPAMQERQIKILGLPAPIVQYSVCPESPIFWNAMNYEPAREPEPWYPLNLAPDTGFQKVDAVGTGCIIIHRDVLLHPDLRKPFERGFNAFGVAVRGLDLWFCEKAQAAGFEVWTHTGYPCEHWWEVPLGRLSGLITVPSSDGQADRKEKEMLAEDLRDEDQMHQSSNQEALVRLDA